MHKMFRLILLSFVLTYVVSEKPSGVPGFKLPYHKNIAITNKPNPNVDAAYMKVDDAKNMEKEILELKMMFEAKGQAMNKEMEKMQTKLDYQEEKMEKMEKSIKNLKETVGSQGRMIHNLKNSKTKAENELKTKIYQQERVIEVLKQETEQLVNTVSNMEMTINALEEKTSSEIVDIVGAFNETVNKRNLMTKNIVSEKSIEEQTVGHNLEVQFLKRKDVAKTRTTKRQITGGIAFSAYLSHNIPHLAIGHTVKCDQIIINDGNAYSKFTGAFTVPETGVYLITFTFDVYDHARYEGIQLVVNNRNIVDGIAEGNDDKHAMGGNTAILTLTQGEKVWLESYYSRDGEIVSSTSSKLTTFSGVLLYS